MQKRGSYREPPRREKVWMNMYICLPSLERHIEVYSFVTFIYSYINISLDVRYSFFNNFFSFRLFSFLMSVSTRYCFRSNTEFFFLVIYNQWITGSIFLCNFTKRIISNEPLVRMYIIVQRGKKALCVQIIFARELLKSEEFLTSNSCLSILRIVVTIRISSQDTNYSHL